MSRPLVIIEKGSVANAQKVAATNLITFLEIRGGSRHPVIHGKLIFADKGSVTDVPYGYTLIELNAGSAAPSVVTA